MGSKTHTPCSGSPHSTQTLMLCSISLHFWEKTSGNRARSRELRLLNDPAKKSTELRSYNLQCNIVCFNYLGYGDWTVFMCHQVPLSIYWYICLVFYHSPPPLALILFFCLSVFRCGTFTPLDCPIPHCYITAVTPVCRIIIYFQSNIYNPVIRNNCECIRKENLWPKKWHQTPESRDSK